MRRNVRFMDWKETPYVHNPWNISMPVLTLDTGPERFVSLNETEPGTHRHTATLFKKFLTGMIAFSLCAQL